MKLSIITTVALFCTFMSTISSQGNAEIAESLEIQSTSHIGRDYLITCGNRQEIFANNDLVTYGNSNIEFRIGVAPLDNKSFLIRNKTGALFFEADGDDQYVGIGLGDGQGPKSKLHIKDGDLYIEGNNQGMILQDTNGACWEITVNTSGGLTSTNINCP